MYAAFDFQNGFARIIAEHPTLNKVIGYMNTK